MNTVLGFKIEWDTEGLQEKSIFNNFVVVFNNVSNASPTLPSVIQDDWLHFTIVSVCVCVWDIERKQWKPDTQTGLKLCFVNFWDNFQAQHEPISKPALPLMMHKFSFELSEIKIMKIIHVAYLVNCLFGTRCILNKCFNYIWYLT